MKSKIRMKNLITFIKMPLSRKLVLTEAYVLLGFSRFIIISMPFKRIAGWLGEKNQEMESSNEDIDLSKVQQVSGAIKIISKYTFWESKCLVQAYAAKFMLNRRKQKSTVYLGVARDENGEMIAHAWVRCGGIYITGGNGSGKFAITGKFS